MVIGGIGVGQVAAESGQVADEGIGYDRRGLNHHRILGAQKLGVFQSSLTSQGANAQVPIPFFDKVQTWNPVNVNDIRRRCESEFHQRNEALPTGEDLGLFAIGLQKGQSLRQCGGGKVFELCGDHLLTSHRAMQ